MGNLAKRIDSITFYKIQTMKWLYLFTAIVLEVVGTVAIKNSNGFTNLKPTILLIIAYSLSFFFLSLALKFWKVGVAYATWSGLGNTLIVLVSIYYFKENISMMKIVSILLIVLGVISLNLSK